MRTIYWKKERLQNSRYVNRTCVALVLQGPLCKTALKCIKQTGDCSKKKKILQWTLQAGTGSCFGFEMSLFV